MKQVDLVPALHNRTTVDLVPALHDRTKLDLVPAFQAESNQAQVRARPSASVTDGS